MRRNVDRKKRKARSIGGGSGGGATADRMETSEAGYHIRANQVEILSRPPVPPGIPGPSVITLLAGGTGTDGLVNVRGSQGVRVTAGTFLLPPTSSESTNGVEIATDEMQNVTIQRGLLPGIDQQIEMTPTGITVDGGIGTITVQSLTQITLSVAGGLSSITLTPAGVIIQGLIIQIN